MPSYIDRLKAISRDLKLLWMAVFSLMLGFGIYSATFFNFITEILHIDPHQLGAVESIRELPGLLCVVIAALSMRIVEPLLGTLALTFVAVGMSAYSTIDSVPELMLWSFVWSIGLHTWMPISSSLVMSLTKEGERGKRLGQTLAVGSLGAAVGMGSVLVVGHGLHYHVWFLIGGVCSAIAAVTLLGMKRSIGHADKPRLVWKRRYRLYYILTFLEGCRKQVFFTFAPFALTKVYGTPLRVMALLALINNLVGFVGSPIVGRLIDRIGEKRILMPTYTAVVLVFIGYATTQNVHWLYIFFCLDSALYLSTACLTTYLQKIAAAEDLMPTLSLGVTMNHAAAVLVPLIGAGLWTHFSYPVTFFGGAVVAAVSLIFASRTGLKKTEASTS